MNDSNEQKKAQMVKILRKAQKDKAFRKRLLENPEAALKQEGVTVRSGIHVKFMPREKDTFYYFIPSEKGEELSEDEMLKLSAGTGAGYYADPDDFDPNEFYEYGPPKHD